MVSGTTQMNLRSKVYARMSPYHPETTLNNYVFGNTSCHLAFFYAGGVVWDFRGGSNSNFHQVFYAILLVA